LLDFNPAGAQTFTNILQASNDCEVRRALPSIVESEENQMSQQSRSNGTHPIADDLHRELAFLRYRKNVVSLWPEESQRSTALAGIEWRIRLIDSALNRGPNPLTA